MPFNLSTPTCLMGAAAGVAAAAVLMTFCLPSFAASGHKVGLGKVLTTQDGGQIFGFDIDQHGQDGVLASARTIDSKGDVRVSVETFDQNTGTITKSFAKYVGMRNEYAVDGVVAGDIALVTHYITPRDRFTPAEPMT